MMNFGEKNKEFSPKHGKELPVWQTPKYLESKAKAEEIVTSKRYNVTESDFWILMNVTKSEKMAYTGLIISHNGCLKINDCLESRFDPACVFLDKDGYNGSLVYTYSSPEQGIYEVGEVSQSNCKNAYPYAMAFKRLFDRVVLKLSKLAYAGIYSDSEAEEFSRRDEGGEEEQQPPQPPKKTAPPQPAQPTAPLFICRDCRETIRPCKHNGEEYPASKIAEVTEATYGVPLCWDCAQIRATERKMAQQ